MNLTELLVVACGLSMDAFAASVCKGMAAGPDSRRPLLTGLYFGFFQALMPLIGFLAGVRFVSMIDTFDHWIAFCLLSVIGVNMLLDARRTESPPDASFAPAAMLPVALATSVDALAVGVSFAFLNVRILPAVGLIGAATLLLSALGVCLGSLFGTKLRAQAETAGGIILILTGLNILMEHLNKHP